MASEQLQHASSTDRQLYRTAAAQHSTNTLVCSAGKLVIRYPVSRHSWFAVAINGAGPQLLTQLLTNVRMCCTFITSTVLTPAAYGTHRMGTRA